jgi:hypothetical protein
MISLLPNHADPAVYSEYSKAILSFSDERAMISYEHVNMNQPTKLLLLFFTKHKLYMLLGLSIIVLDYTCQFP